MKYLIFAIFILFKSDFGYAQIPLEGKESTKTEIGFIYYTNKDYPTFVPEKAEKKELSYNDFSTDSLNFGYQLSREGGFYYLKDFEKCGQKYKLYNFWNDSVFLTIIPVKIIYTVWAYAFREDQMKELRHIEKFKFFDKWVEIEAVGGMPINVTSLKPLCDSNIIKQKIIY